MTAREVALLVLTEVTIEKAYSNHALNDKLNKSDLSSQDKGFTTELVYGTLKHQQLLSFYVEPYVLGRLKGWVKLLVLLTVYQLVFLKNIPPHAAIAESVAIAKKRGGQFNANLVNGICREFMRKPLRSLDEIEDEFERLSIETTHPTWILKLWSKQYGHDVMKRVAFANNERVSVKLRVNTLKTSKKELVLQLEKEGIEVNEETLCFDALKVVKGNVANTQAFKEGLCYIQDEASMLAAYALSPKPNDLVLDCCSAPGGKTTHLAQLMHNTGVIKAHDIYEHKLKLIHENATRLGVTNINASVLDATTLHTMYEKEYFDAILVDAPCTGLGVIRRHPEAKMLKSPQDLDVIVQIQQQILTNASDLLKIGGRLVYSTCTVNRKENDKMVEQFLKMNPNFECDHTLSERLPATLDEKINDGMLQLFPGEFDTDGFFIAALKRVS